MTVRALIIAATLSLGACATNVGTQSINDFARYQQVEPGVTDKKQLYGVFGQPHRVTYISETGESNWRYYQVTSRMNPTTFIPFVGMVTGGNDLDITRADFYFDSNSVLIRSQREQRSRYVNQWLGMADSMTPDGSVNRVEIEMQLLGLPFDRREAQIAAGWADMDE
ncbi:hypothetical protein [Brevundimonas sp.]|uniref:hypothetical protein n=1 Tax=Brevundimonas sp. TaxID=1871086 RepID=UPI002AB9CBC8|nr:hypothetical protein [Brevundimonas sp.]MDZ4363122.1 hypothetical protein [Brevundimonas sp.]